MSWLIVPNIFGVPVIFVVSWLIVSTKFGMSVIYNVFLSCDGEISCLFPYFLYMVDSTKQPASVGLAQACPNHEVMLYHIPFSHLCAKTSRACTFDD